MAFALHALAIMTFGIFQCFIYKVGCSVEIEIESAMSLSAM